MLTLTRNKKPVDLLPGTTILLEYQNPLFEPLGQPAKSFSYGFDLPVTGKNQFAFGFPENLHVRNNLAVAPGELFYNGAKLLEGDLVPVKANNTRYRVTLQGNRKLEWADEGIDTAEARDSGQITLHRPKMLYADKYEFPMSSINDGSAATQISQLNYKELIQWKAQKNNWTVVFDWDAAFDELYLFTPNFDNVGNFPGDEQRVKIPSVKTLLFELQKLIGLFIAFDYNTQQINVTMLKDQVNSISAIPIGLFSPDYEKEYNRAEGTIEVNMVRNDGLFIEEYEDLYTPYLSDGETINTNMNLLPVDGSDRMLFFGDVPPLFINNTLYRFSGSGFDISTDLSSYVWPLAVYFRTSATTGNFNNGSVNLRLDELGPTYWAPYANLYKNSEIITRKLYLNFNQVRGLSPLQAFYIEGNRYLYRKIEVLVPDRPVKYFEAEATLLRID